MSKVTVRAVVALFENGEYIVMGASPVLGGENITDADVLQGLKEAAGQVLEPYTVRWLMAPLSLTESVPDEIEATEEAAS